MIDSIEELERLLYEELEKTNDELLSFDRLDAIIQSKAEFGIRKVNGEAIRRLRERADVEQLKDDKGRMTFRLIKKENLKEKL